MKYLLYAFIFFLLVGCQPKAENEKPDKKERQTYEPILPKKELNVGFLMLNGVYNSELMAPFDVFHHTKFRRDTAMKVFTVGLSMDTVLSFEGLRLLPDYTLRTTPRIDVLVVPSAKGNMGADLENDSLIEWVAATGADADYIISLCDGAFILAKAGLLDGLHATTFPSDIIQLSEWFPKVTVHEGVSFVHHGKAITSAGGAKSYDAALYLVERLYGRQDAIDTGEGICIDWDLNSIEHRVFE